MHEHQYAKQGLIVMLDTNFVSTPVHDCIIDFISGWKHSSNHSLRERAYSDSENSAGSPEHRC